MLGHRDLVLVEPAEVTGAVFAGIKQHSSTEWGFAGVVLDPDHACVWLCFQMLATIIPIRQSWLMKKARSVRKKVSES